MQRLTTRGIRTAEAIAKREEFRTSGALSAEKHSPTNLYLYSGRLDHDEAMILSADLRIGIDYVVWSYSTPIAWHRADDTWHIVAQKFSRTTTKHQGNLYLIPRQPTVPGFDCETHAYSLSDCKHWDTPGPECSGPRVGATDDGVILCEGHFNAANYGG